MLPPRTGRAIAALQERLPYPRARGEGWGYPSNESFAPARAREDGAPPEMGSLKRLLGALRRYCDSCLIARRAFTLGYRQFYPLLRRARIVRRSLAVFDGAREAAGETVVGREPGLRILVDLDVAILEVGRHVARVLLADVAVDALADEGRRADQRACRIAARIDVDGAR